MKYINRQELAKKMNYSNYSSFMNSKTNKDLLIALVNYIESEVIKDYDHKISVLNTSYESKLIELKASFRKDLLLLTEKYK